MKDRVITEDLANKILKHWLFGRRICFEFSKKLTIDELKAISHAICNNIKSENATFRTIISVNDKTFLDFCGWDDDKCNDVLVNLGNPDPERTSDISRKINYYTKRCLR